MPNPSFFDQIERLFEHLLNSLEAAINHPIVLLERYSVRMYRFFKDMALKILRLSWLLATLSFYVLAPLYVGSFGDELMRRGVNSFVRGIGLLFMVLGTAGVILLAVGLVVYLVPLFNGTKSTLYESAPTDKPKRGLAALIAFDLGAILFIYSTYAFLAPGYMFTSPLLVLTQNLLLGRF